MRPRAQFAVWISCLGMLAARVCGSEFRLQERHELAPEHGFMTLYCLTDGQRTFAFLPPQGWRVQLQAEVRRVVFQSREAGTFVGVRIVHQVTNSPVHWTADKQLRAMEERFNNARVLEQFPCMAIGVEGKGFIVSHATPEGFSLKTRLALLPLSDGYVELELSGPASQFDRCRPVWDGVVGSFRIEPCEPRESRLPPPAAGPG